MDRDKLLKKWVRQRRMPARFARLLDVKIPAINEPISEQTFFWKINRSRYRQVHES